MPKKTASVLQMQWKYDNIAILIDLDSCPRLILSLVTFDL